MTSHITEVYFRAWKKAREDVQEEIESSCVHDFMQNAIFLRRTSPVHAKVRQVEFLSSAFSVIAVFILQMLFFADCELFPLQEGLSQGGQDALSSLQAHPLEGSKCECGAPLSPPFF